MPMPPKKPMPKPMPKGKKADPMDSFWSNISKPASAAQQTGEMLRATAYKPGSAAAAAGAAKKKAASGPPPLKHKYNSGVEKAESIMGSGDKPKGKKKK